MGRRGWIVVGVVSSLLASVLVVASSYGVFDTHEDLERRGAEADADVFEVIEVVDGAVVDASAPDGGAPEHGGHSLALSGRAALALHNFAMNDKHGRRVLRAKKVTGSFDVHALKRGTFRMTKAKIEGAEVTLYRDATGKISIINALRSQPPSVQRTLYLPPKEELEGEPWLLDIGPIEVEDATLTLGFTKKPVVFHVDRAKIAVRRRKTDEGPLIYIEEVEGHLMKPKPLPKPVRIAWAKGLVRLKGAPLVNLSARTCVGRDELRVNAAVPARKQPVKLTIDSAGIGGALGRMGVRIAARHKSDKMSYAKGGVTIEGGPKCK